MVCKLTSLNLSPPSSRPLPPPEQTTNTPASNIYLKLENLQPGGSFKSRGIGTLIARAAARATPDRPPHFYCSSGGNAGLACITAAKSLGYDATIVVPTPTSPHMISVIRSRGASVHIFGASWAEADAHMRDEHMAHDPAAVYVPPFDHPDIWDGHSTLVAELSELGAPVHGVVCSVGGGGLLNGIMAGLETWTPTTKPRVLAVETAGADSLNLCARTGTHASLDAITSIATTLGARRVSRRSFDWLRASADNNDLSSIVVHDWEAAMSCVRFADDARIVVEPACGATLAPAYFADQHGANRLRTAFERDGLEWAEHNVVLVVCGGSSASLEALGEYREKYGALADAATAPAANGVASS